MDPETLIEWIVKLEWEMFTAVANVGGRADCQDDLQTFQIMRRSQALTWSPALLQSYMNDLQVARRCGMNLMTIKYARMMEYTHPDEYARIKDHLPLIPDQTRQLIDEIIAVHLQWDREMIERYPHLRSRGRPATHAGDSASVTSAETYLRGELMTFSERSIAILHHDTLAAQAAGVNLAEQTLRNMVQAYGYGSLEEAERRLGGKG